MDILDDDFGMVLVNTVEYNEISAVITTFESAECAEITKYSWWNKLRIFFEYHPNKTITKLSIYC